MTPLKEIHLSNHPCSGTRIPPRHKTGQVGRLKQDSPSTWIFSSNRRNTWHRRRNEKQRIRNSHKNGCEVYTPSIDGGGRPRLTRSIIFFDTPILYSGPRWASLGSRRSRGETSPVQAQRGFKILKFSVMGSGILSVTNRVGGFVLSADWLSIYYI